MEFYGPEVVLVALLDHGDDDDKKKRHEPRLRGDGRVYHPGENQRYLQEKVKSESVHKVFSPESRN